MIRALAALVLLGISGCMLSKYRVVNAAPENTTAPRMNIYWILHLDEDAIGKGSSVGVWSTNGARMQCVAVKRVIFETEQGIVVAECRNGYLELKDGPKL